jgi:hypothetical protein
VLRKPTRNSRADDDVPDVAADDPVGTMDRFRMGLRRVLDAPKVVDMRQQPKPRRKKRKT